MRARPNVGRMGPECAMIQKQGQKMIRTITYHNVIINTSDTLEIGDRNVVITSIVPFNIGNVVIPFNTGSAKPTSR